MGSHISSALSYPGESSPGRGQVRLPGIHAIAFYEFELRWNEEMLKRIKHLPPLSGGPSLRRSKQK